MTSRHPSQMIEEGRDQVVRLEDGRALGLRHYGDEGGAPVVFFHGFPGSRLEACLGHYPAAQAGVHLIGLDRPGFGLSDFKPQRTLGSWPADVAEAMSLLGIDRFGVVGVSGGGPYALACAARIPDQLTGVAAVSGIAPPEAPGIAEAFRRNAAIFKIGRIAPFVPRILLSRMSQKLRRNPDELREYLLPIVPPSDKAILERDEIAEALRADQLEAFRNGARGPTHECVLLVKPWDFDLEDIRGDVHVWQGDADIQVSVESVEYLVSRLAQGILHFIPGGGHYLIVEEFPQILAATTPQSSG